MAFTTPVYMEISGTPPKVQDVWIYTDDTLDFSVHDSFYPDAVDDDDSVPVNKPFYIERLTC